MEAAARPAQGSVDITPPGTHRGWLRHVAALSNPRHSTRLLAGIAFADSSFLPIPPDLLLVPMSLLRPERMRFLVILCTVASSLGAVLGYLIGWSLWSSVGARLVEFYNCQEGFAEVQDLVTEWGMPVIIIKGLTPIPFKIAAIAAGVASMNPLAFITAAVIGRALHFAMVWVLLLVFGARFMSLVARYERRLAIASFAALIVVGLVWWLR